MGTPSECDDSVQFLIYEVYISTTRESGDLAVSGSPLAFGSVVFILEKLRDIGNENIRRIKI